MVLAINELRLRDFGTKCRKFEGERKFEFERVIEVENGGEESRKV